MAASAPSMLGSVTNRTRRLPSQDTNLSHQSFACHPKKSTRRVPRSFDAVRETFDAAVRSTSTDAPPPGARGAKGGTSYDELDWTEKSNPARHPAHGVCGRARRDVHDLADVGGPRRPGEAAPRAPGD